jgi:hypothetical protein
VLRRKDDTWPSASHGAGGKLKSKVAAVAESNAAGADVARFTGAKKTCTLLKT